MKGIKNFKDAKLFEISDTEFLLTTALTKETFDNSHDAEVAFAYEVSVRLGEEEIVMALQEAKTLERIEKDKLVLELTALSL
jgi:hypothetical protein